MKRLGVGDSTKLSWKSVTQTYGCHSLVQPTLLHLIVLSYVVVDVANRRAAGSRQVKVDFMVTHSSHVAYCQRCVFYLCDKQTRFTFIIAKHFMVQSCLVYRFFDNPVRSVIRML